ncbi:MAG: hypothetical protein CMO55_08040 [Verrucomicrobiales bacterium]|nr:hypothetical protein [Verrucomicrobiales bacterium]
MQPLPENFGSRLKSMRLSYRDDDHTKSGLTLHELGQRAGVHYTRIAAFESGRRMPGLKSLEKLANAFGLTGEDAEEFVASGRKDARMNKTKQDFPLIPNAIQKQLLEEISKALQSRGVSEIREIYDHPDCDLMWTTDKDEWFAVEIATACGRSEKEALHRLSRKLESKGKKVRRGGRGSEE